MRDFWRELPRLRNRYLMAVDGLMLLLIPVITIVVRLESISRVGFFAQSLIVFTLITLALKMAVFVRTGLYSHYWAYASVDEMLALLKATSIAWLVEIVVFFAVLRPFGLVTESFPRSMPFLDGLLTIAHIAGFRLSIRLAFSLYRRGGGRADERSVLIAGAGVAGAMVVKELQVNRQLALRPVAFVDDDPRKIGKRIHGIRVLARLDDIPTIVRDWDIKEVVVAMPMAPGSAIRRVVQLCHRVGVPSRTIPGLFEILRGTARVDQIRNIQLEDLLRRGTVKIEPAKVAGFLHGKCVMVTGAGGSIGAELCRQIKEFGPSELVLLGHGENSIFSIAKELEEHPRRDMAIQPVIADIRDRERMDQIFTRFRPEVVFHAAAHKHVPLMERNVADAVTNNILGTRNLADLAEKHRTGRLVMISSDKAVNPTSVMGVTKRIAELVVRDGAQRTGKMFMTVRFGNVLGSRGSVVPFFKRQIERGGPITITHPDVRRFFMTIPEAVHLVLQAGAMGTGGEVFVLDMGEQIRIEDLAKDLIRLSGCAEDEIGIQYTGLRAGEKLFEELFYESETMERTEHEKIFVTRLDGPGSGLTASFAHEHPFRVDVDTMIEAAQQGAGQVAVRLMKKLVPQYRPMGEQESPPVRTAAARIREEVGARR